jgi:hypothetical protein
MESNFVSATVQNFAWLDDTGNRAEAAHYQKINKAACSVCKDNTVLQVNLICVPNICFNLHLNHYATELKPICN